MLTRYLSGVFLFVAAVCAAGPLRVFVSIEPQLESVERIGGELVEVHALVPAGASPETYVPGPGTMAALGRTALYIRIGAPFEAALLKKIRPMFPELKIIDGTKNMEFRELDEAEMAAHVHCGHHHHGACEACEQERHGHAAHDGHGHGEKDPHVWLSVGNMVAHARNVGDALCAELPDKACELRARTAETIADLRRLDAEIAAALKPLEGRRIFVFHPAFGYFLSRYKLKQTPVELGGKEPMGRHLCHLIREAKEHGIKAIYTQPQFNGQAAEVLAKEIGGKVLPLDPLPLKYSEGMRNMCRQLLK